MSGNVTIISSGATSVTSITHSSAPAMTTIGHIAIDDTDDQLQYYGTAARVLSYKQDQCAVMEKLAAADDNFALGTTTYARTIVKVGCRCHGTCTTKADISLEDDSGNAMTHTTPTCSTAGTVITYQSVTAANTLVAGEGLRFDVTNTPSPDATDTYEICVEYTIDAQ